MKLALRHLLKSPGFAVVAIVTLALGLGVNTAMFSVVHTLLLKPAPYPEAGRVVRVFRSSQQASDWPLSLPDLRDVAEQNSVFASLTPFQWWSFSLAEPGQPAEAISGAIAGAELFNTLGLSPALGRGFTAEEQQPGRDHVVVISHEFWQRRFGGDPAVVGRTLRIDGQNLDVIGVMPEQAEYPIFWGRLEMWQPLPLVNDWRENRDVRWLEAIGRLKPGVTLAQAQAELSGIAARLAEQYPESNAAHGLRVVPFAGSDVAEVNRNLTWLTLGLAGMVLLIACANLGNLQLARSAARMRDFAIHAALGATRSTLMRRLLVESILIALLGGAAGLLLAMVFLDAIAPSMLAGAAKGALFAIDLRVLVFAAAIALFAGIASGCVPAWFASRADVNSGLKQQTRGSTGDRSRQHVRQALIVVQIAFSLVLLAGSGFFIRGLQRVTSRDPGWRVEGLLKGTMTIPETRGRSDDYFRQFHERVLERVARMPGVDRVALATALPVQGYNTPNTFLIEGRAEPPRGQEPLAYDNNVSPEYFSTVGIRLVEGRIFDRTVGPADPPVVVINEGMARQLWPGESAVGKRIRSTNPQWHPWLEIVGVVRDVTFAGNFGTLPTRLQIYHAISQQPWGYFTVVLRSSAPETLVEPLRRAIAELDPDLPVVDLRPMTQAVANAQHDLRVANQLLAAFSALGLLLAAIGLYGVISGLVVQRTQEFGIRLALGAQPRDVLWMVLGKGAALAGLGVIVGLGGAAALLRVLGSLIPGLPGQDALGLAVAVALMLVVTLLATFFPARRATKVDPLIAMKAE